MRIVCAGLVVFLASACGHESGPKSQPQNVFGADNRVAMTSSETPWSAIGRLNRSDGSWCTATLVASNLVLSAAHCAFDDNNNWMLTGMQFLPNFQGGTSQVVVGITKVTVGTTKPNADRVADWAIFTLNDNVGSQYGFPSIHDTLTSNFPDTVTLAAYSQDFDNGNTAGVAQNCDTRNRIDGLIFHDCAAARGSSGGPMLATTAAGERYIAGLNVAEYRNGGDSSEDLSIYVDAQANVAIPTHDFLAQVNLMIGN